MCCCLQKESFIWGVCNFLFFFIARIMNCRNYDHHSIISFFIYKEWLLLTLKDKKQNPAIALSYFKNELNLRIQIYEKCTNINTDYIESLKDLEVCL